TLFVVTSKSFTTQETLANAASARAWLVAALGTDVDVRAHFMATTANPAAAKSFGVAEADILPWWDWVGGRYCLWSPAGFPIALIVPIAATYPLGDQQMLLVANALASARALMTGRGADDIRAELAVQQLSAAELDAAVAARVCPGDRASTMMLMPGLSPFTL